MITNKIISNSLQLIQRRQIRKYLFRQSLKFVPWQIPIEKD